VKIGLLPRRLRLYVIFTANTTKLVDAPAARYVEQQNES